MDPYEHTLGVNEEGLERIGPIPQDVENYVRKQGRYMSPGCRVESGLLPGTNITAATSAGVKLLKKNGQEVITVAHHGLLAFKEVWHPYSSNGDKIGRVIDTRPELDIALVELTPEASNAFRNDGYFQAETPKYIHSGELANRALDLGLWSEVDGMSSGLVSLYHIATMDLEPVRPPGHREIPSNEWREVSGDAIYGVCNSTIAGGMCGASIVLVNDGGVTGVFHLSDGIMCFSAALDDLRAEGWVLA